MDLKVTRTRWHYFKAAGILTALVVIALLGFAQWNRNVDVLSSRLQGELPQGQFEDYIVFYSAGQMVLEGNGGSLYDLEAVQEVETRAMGRLVGEPSQNVLAYFNPPYVAAMFAPIGALSLTAADALIFSLAALSVVVGGVLTLGLIEEKSRAIRIVFWLLFVTSGAVTWLVIQGQVTMLVVIGLAGFIGSDLRGRERPAGAILALALMKPHFVIFPVLYMLLNRRWESLKTFSGICAVLAMVSVAVSGLGILYTYPAFLIESATWEAEAGVNLANMFSWSGFLARTLGGTGWIHHLLTAGLTVATVTVLVAVAASTRTGDDGSRHMAFAIGILGTLLISAHFYLQDAALLALVAVLGYSFARSKGRSVRLWLVVVGIAWLSQAYARRFLFDYDINILTPAIVAMLGASVYAYFWHSEKTASKVAEPTRTLVHVPKAA